MSDAMGPMKPIDYSNIGEKRGFSSGFQRGLADYSNLEIIRQQQQMQEQQQQQQHQQQREAHLQQIQDLELKEKKFDVLTRLFNGEASYAELEEVFGADASEKFWNTAQVKVNTNRLQNDVVLRNALKDGDYEYVIENAEEMAQRYKENGNNQLSRIYSDIARYSTTDPDKALELVNFLYSSNPQNKPLQESLKAQAELDRTKAEADNIRGQTGQDTVETGILETEAGLRGQQMQGEIDNTTADTALVEAQEEEIRSRAVLNELKAQNYQRLTDEDLLHLASRTNLNNEQIKNLAAERDEIYAKIDAMSKNVDKEATDYVTKLRLRVLDAARPVLTEARESMVTYGKMASSALEGNGAGDLALVFSFMRMLDPGSVVRESEFKQAMKTTGLGGSIYAGLMRLKRGDSLTPQQRLDFVKLGQEYHKIVTDSAEFGLGPLRDILESNDIDPKDLNLLEYEAISENIEDYKSKGDKEFTVSEDQKEEITENFFLNNKELWDEVLPDNNTVID